MQTHPAYQQYNPFREPQWRGERALSLVEGAQGPRRASPKSDDQYVRQYRNFLVKYLPQQDESLRLALFPRYPALYYAHQLQYHPDREWRTFCQARLLARQSDKEIGEAIGTLPEAVAWYEALFFNVRDRLDNHDWIVKTVLGTRDQRAANREGSITDHQRELLYKIYGYFGGPMILDVIISGFVSGNLPKNKAGIPGWFDSTWKTMMRSRSAEECRVFEHNRYTVMQLFEIHLAIMNAEQASADGPLTESDKNIETMLLNLGSVWGMAHKGLELRTEQQQQYAISATEPRASEQLMLGAGVIPTQLAERAERVGKSRALLTKE